MDCGRSLLHSSNKRRWASHASSSASLPAAGSPTTPDRSPQAATFLPACSLLFCNLSRVGLEVLELPVSDTAPHDIIKSILVVGHMPICVTLQPDHASSWTWNPKLRRFHGAGRSVTVDSPSGDRHTARSPRRRESRRTSSAVCASQIRSTRHRDPRFWKHGHSITILPQVSSGATRLRPTGGKQFPGTRLPV